MPPFELSVGVISLRQPNDTLSGAPASPALRGLSRRATWWAREDLNLRPHAYQARALTS